MARSKIIGKGTRLQTGLNHQLVNPNAPNTPNGLLLRGTVMATYVTDHPNHPKILDIKNKPLAVYCDVLVYPSIPRQRWFTLKQVLVSQKRGGLHDDDIWKPKATQMNIVTQVLEPTVSANPGQFDGDCVLVGFMNNSFDEPIILKGLPHPSRDVGNEAYELGKRLKLKLVDGTPNNAAALDKYQGVFRGVDNLGNHIVDSTFGHAGILLPLGLEPPPDILGISGNQTRNLPENSKHETVLYNMLAPLVPIESAKFSQTKDGLEILIGMLPTLEVTGSLTTAALTLGSGLASATVAEQLELLWIDMVSWLALHTHAGISGETAVPTQAATIPVWTSTCASTRLTFPVG